MAVPRSVIRRVGIKMKIGTDLGFYKVTDANFCHDRNGYRINDGLDHGGVALEGGDGWINETCLKKEERRTMRETPPSLRISAGTRSSAMTAHAPASSAMRA